MSFDGKDLEAMFADAVSASEDTGEKDPSGTASKKDEPKPKKESVKKEEQKTVSNQPKPKPVITPSANKIDGINEQLISKIIKMNGILNNYEKQEVEFIRGYFQKEKGTAAEIIYEALTAERRDLDALNKIVEARGKKSADRAFYLMELDNNSLDAIVEQVNLLTGELDEEGEVDDHNKISMCRNIESVISKMGGDVFAFIDRLQEFTSIATS